MNGYFRIRNTSTSTNLELFAPTDGGAPVRAQEVIGYLSGKGISYDAGALNRAIEIAVAKDNTVTLNMLPGAPIAAMDVISISSDKMTAFCRLYPNSVEGSKISAEEIKKDLIAKGVKLGILDDKINELAENPVYCEDIVVAQGQAPVESVDGYIEYLFNTDNKKKPTLLEDGSVDFFHLNVLQSCAVGQELAILHPAVKGDNGQGVDGSIVKSKDPKNVAFKHGNNIHVDETGSKLISDVDGNVALVNGTVFVNSSLVFESVSTATGNIEFEGSVVIEGNIDTNFEVRVKGDVVVNGVIEGAYVEAGGNIIVAKGVNGMGKATLKAGGNIIAKYLENVDASAGGYIASEAIMHSSISAGGDILVDGRKGMISGGKAIAGGQVIAKTLGSEMANDTIIEVGMPPMVKREIMDLRTSLEEKQKTMAQIMPVLNNMAMKIKSGAALSDEQRVYVGKLMGVQKTTTAEIASITERLMNLEDKYDVDTPSEVKVRGVVYPGTKVTISDVSMSVKSATKYCRFVKLRGDVKIQAYE